jgi:enoyl-CoA hydratase/carnithine racemase
MDVVLFEKRNHIAFVTINRPEALNATNREVRVGLLEAWDKIDDDPEIWIAVVTGAGDRAFSVGGDIKEGIEYREKLSPLEDFPFNTAKTYADELKKPLIGAINGYAFGNGFMLALNCDIKVASENASFGLPEVKLGFPPMRDINIKVCQYFPISVASELLLLGEPLNAQEAYRLGFVNKVVAKTQLLETAEAYAKKISELSPLGTTSIKRAIRIGTCPSPQAVAFSDTIGRMTRYSEDYKEGRRAFVEKRKPVWKGK